VGPELTLTTIVLLIISAIIHALWNLIGKRENPSPSFFITASAVSCLCLAPALFAHRGMAGQFSENVWLLLAATGFFQAIYYTGLAGAYRSGHLSIAYPLARSAPVIMVAIVTLLIGTGHPPNTQAVIGMALIALGGLVLPVERPRDWKLKDYIHASSLFALIAAAGTTGYSIIDDSALRILRSTPALHSSRITVTLVYAFFENASALAWLTLIVLLGRIKGVPSPKPAKNSSGSAALAGIGICAAYALVLLAMTFAKNVSYIVAFRQLSIPIGAILGITILREPRYPAKLAGMAIMFAGLVLVAIH